VRVFETGYPTRPQITSPGNLSEGNSAKTEIIWEADTDTDSVYAELSTDGFFSEIYHYERFGNDPGSGIISVSLRPFTWYFLRIRAENEYGSGVFSAVKYFKTDQGTNIPAILDEYTRRFIVYPTVVDKIVNIQSNNPDVVIEKIDIIDISGRTVFTSGPLMEKAVMIQTDKAIPDSSGPYFLKITSGAFFEVVGIFVTDY
jgi:hypothetical protein